MQAAQTAALPPRGLEAGFAAIEKVLVVIAGTAILASGVITCTSVFGRWLFGWAIPDGEIIVRNLMIVSCVLPLSVVAGRHAHIAVDLVVRHFPPRLRKAVDVFNGVIGVFILVLITWSGWINLETSWVRKSYFDGRLELSEWPVRLVFFVGYVLFVLRSLQRIGDSPSTAPEIPPPQQET